MLGMLEIRMKKTTDAAFLQMRKTENHNGLYSGDLECSVYCGKGRKEILRLV